MIRIKTLRRLIDLAEIIVNEYYTTGRNEYLTFDAYLELLDTENMARALEISERSAYDYIAAIRKLHRLLCFLERRHNMTRQGLESCKDMTDIQEAEIL